MVNERGNTLYRFLDRYLGIPLVFFLSFFRKKRLLPQKIERIAFLKTAGIGDLVLLSACLADVRKVYPHAKITLFTGMANREMGELIEGVESVALPIKNPFQAIKSIRQGTYDVWIDCGPWPRINALFSWAARSSFTIGFKTDGQYRHFLFDQSVEHKSNRHEIENYRALVAKIGVVSSSLPKLVLPQLAMQIKKRMALHLYPGGLKGHLRQWPALYWKKLIDEILKRGFEVFLTGSEKDRKHLAPFVCSPNVINGAGLSLKQTALELQCCKAVVSVDTGIMHLAAALGIPVIALHGPSSIMRWGALGLQVYPLTAEAYHPCVSLGFDTRCKKNRCMRKLAPEQVIEKLAFLQLF